MIVMSQLVSGGQTLVLSYVYVISKLLQVRIRVYRGHTDGVTSGQFLSNDSRILTSSSDKTIKVWKTDTGHILRTYLGGHSAAISKSDVSPDEQRYNIYFVIINLFL